MNMENIEEAIENMDKETVIDIWHYISGLIEKYPALKDLLSIYEEEIEYRIDDGKYTPSNIHGYAGI